MPNGESKTAFDAQRWVAVHSQPRDLVLRLFSLGVVMVRLPNSARGILRSTIGEQSHSSLTSTGPPDGLRV